MHAHVPRGAATAMEGPCFESSLASEKLDGHSARNQKVEWRPGEAVWRRGRVRRTSFSRSDQSKPLTLQSREGLTASCCLGLHVNREPLLQAGPG